MIRYRVEQARLDVASPTENAQRRWSERRSALVSLHWDGLVGFGEVAPLPGYSPDTLDEALAWLSRLNGRALAAALGSAQPGALLPTLRGLLVDAPPSARYALELAALDWVGLRLQLPAWQLLGGSVGVRTGPQPRESARLVSLWGPHAGHLPDLDEPRQPITLKAKIGRDLAAEARLLCALVAARPGPVRLRLDANQALDPATWPQQLDPFVGLPIEFIEEPCRPAALGAPRQLAFPLAFDEALQRPDDIVFALLDSWLDSGFVGALVLKPMVLGGVERCQFWSRRAAASGVDVVVSHTFDGCVASAGHWQLDRVLGSAGRATGLGAHAGLALWAGATDADAPANAPGLGLAPAWRAAQAPLQLTLGTAVS